MSVTGESMTEVERLACNNQAIIETSFPQISANVEPIRLIETLREIKNLTIGSDKQKQAMFILQLSNRVIQELFHLQNVEDEELCEIVKIELISILTSLFKLKVSSGSSYSSSSPTPQSSLLSKLHGGDTQCEQIEQLVVYLVDGGLSSKNDKLAINCSRCLKYIFAANIIHPSVLFHKQDDDQMDSSSSSDSNPIFPQHHHLLDKLLSVLDRGNSGTSFIEHNEKTINVLAILSSVLDERQQRNEIEEEESIKKRQNILVDHTSILQSIPSLLTTDKESVFESTLTLMLNLCNGNERIAKHFVMKLPDCDSSCVSIICDHLGWDKPRSVQLQCCRVLITLSNLRALEANWPKFTHKVLPTLVRLCKSDVKAEHEIEAITLIYLLIEKNAQLQLSAVATERFTSLLIPHLSIQSSSNDKSTKLTNHNSQISKDMTLLNEKRIAVFKALSALCANNNEISASVMAEEIVVNELINGLCDCNCEVKYASLLLLLSVTRSIAMLMNNITSSYNRSTSAASSSSSLGYSSYHRTVESSVTSLSKPIFKILELQTDLGRDDDDEYFSHNVRSAKRRHSGVTNEDLLIVATAVLCNLTLPFCGPEPFGRYSLVEEGIVSVIWRLIGSPNSQIRLNSVWMLMNLSYKANCDIVGEIWKGLTTPLIMSLLTDSFPLISIKIAAVMRNLTMSPLECEQIMKMRGDEIVSCLLTGLSNMRFPELQEQLILVINNISCGPMACFDYILDNDQLVSTIQHILTETDYFPVKVACVRWMRTCVVDSANDVKRVAVCFNQHKLTDALKMLLQSSATLSSSHSYLHHMINEVLRKID